jgi:hypothetical protein
VRYDSGAGVDPTLIPDHVLLSGLTNDLRSTTLQEFWDTSNNSRETLEVLGFGASVEATRNSPAADASAGNFLRQGLYSWAEVMGVTYDRVDFDLSFGIADRDIELDAMTMREGTVARATRRLTGYVGDVPLMAVELNWMVDKSALPAGFEMAVGTHGWLISIEGSPSVRAFIEIRADLKTDACYMVPGDIHSASSIRRCRWSIGVPICARSKVRRVVVGPHNTYCGCSSQSGRPFDRLVSMRSGDACSATR